jgi:phospholipase C
MLNNDKYLVKHTIHEFRDHDMVLNFSRLQFSHPNVTSWRKSMDMLAECLVHKDPLHIS